MAHLYNSILQSKRDNQKLLAVLLDPDKVDLNTLKNVVLKINQSPATHIFVGGSTVENLILDELIQIVKANSSLPVLLFPGNPSQISKEADGILFLSLLSGRNPDYLIEHQVNAVPILRKTQLEVISTGYLLIESGHETAVARVSKTQPLEINNPIRILHTAQAGEMLGNKLLYLEAGSGAQKAVPKDIITLVSQNISIPVLVGGGIKSISEINTAYDSGADLVVIGTAFENDSNFFNQKIGG